MESKLDRRLIVVGVLAFIAVIFLVAAIVVVGTAHTWLKAGSGPQSLSVWEVGGERSEDASIVHLTEKDLELLPAFDSVIRGANRDPGAWRQGETPYTDDLNEHGFRDTRSIGITPVTSVENSVLREWFGFDIETGTCPYIEYDGAYYYFATMIT